jgi:multicomponent Na+:H+ antiporter subunit B
MTEQLIVMALLIILIVITLGIIYLKDLLAAVILSGLYSLVAALVFVVMDAVDVAFTEAAVGAGISTIILLGTLSFTCRQQKSQKHNNFPAMIVVFATGALLIYGTLDMPKYGDATSPANQNPKLAQYYINESKYDTHVPNVVTSVLASYRGYDTLGETAVVFTAGLGVLSLLGLRRRKRKQNSGTDSDSDSSEKSQHPQQSEEQS